MNNTPRTDAALEWVRPAGNDSAPPNEQYVSADFARQLERELAVLQAERDAQVCLLQKQRDAEKSRADCAQLAGEEGQEICADLQTERDAALAQVATLREALDDSYGLAIAWAAHYANDKAYGCGKQHPKHTEILAKIKAALSSTPNTKHPDTERLDWLDALNTNKGVLEATYFANRDAIDAARKEITP